MSVIPAPAGHILYLEFSFFYPIKLLPAFPSLHLDRLKLVRDMFVFNCETGLAYSDLNKLRCEDITSGIDEEKRIRIKSTKTNSITSIALIPEAAGIIKRYQNHPENCSLIVQVLSF